MLRPRNPKHGFLRLHLGFFFQITDDILDRTEDREADGNNLFHHLVDSEVYALRDQTVVKALEDLEVLGHHGETLRALVHHISNRTV